MRPGEANHGADTPATGKRLVIFLFHFSENPGSIILRLLRDSQGQSKMFFTQVKGQKKDQKQWGLD